MDETHKKKVNLEELKNRFLIWLKDPYNKVIFYVLIASFLFRLYYFILTKSQPLWWDEAEYMSYSKGFAGIIDFKGSWGYRLPGFPLLTALFYFIGINSEVVLRFILAFIPSLIVIFLTFAIIKEMYNDKKIAIISTLIITVLWEHVFYSNRFHTENTALIFQFLAIFILFRVYLKDKDFYFIKPKYSLLWILLCSFLSLFFRPGNLIFIPAVILFIIFLNQSFIFNKKNKYLLIGIGLLLIIGFLFFLNLPKTGILAAFHPESKIAWNVINILKGTDVFTGFYKPLIPNFPSVFFYLFIIGIIFFIIDFVIYPEKIKKIKNNEEDLEYKSDIFNILSILSVLSFFVFIMRPEIFEFRWFFPLLPGLLVFTSKGIITTSNYLGSFLGSKKINIILMILFVIIGLYAQINHTDFIVKNKLSSYQQVKESGLFMKENSNADDKIISASIMQHSYYAERKVYSPGFGSSKNDSENEEIFNEEIKKIKPRYLVVSLFEPTPPWYLDWPQRNNNSVYPIKAYFLDPEQKQLALVIYEFNSEKISIS